MRSMRPGIAMRLTAIVSCFALLSTTMGMGVHATVLAAVTAAQEFRTRPGHFTDSPGEVYRGANPDREDLHRGGIWTDESLATLAEQVADNQRRFGTEEQWVGGFATLGFYGYQTMSDASAGDSQSWERSFGGVNTGTGNKKSVYDLVSWPIKGGASLDVHLTHNSKAQMSTVFGHSWRMSYDAELWVTYDMAENENGANVYLPNGSVINFTKSGSTYTAPSGVYDTLVKNGGGTWTLTRKNGTKWEFATTGYSSAWKDRAGNTISITRNGSGYITTLTDPSSRTATFTYSGNKCVSMTDAASRVWEFTYTSNDLTEIEYPALASVDYSRIFTYDSRHNILTETDLRGKVWTNTYNSYDSITSEKTPLNHTTSYSYTTTACTMTLPGGQTFVDNYSSGKIASRVDGASYSESFSNYDSKNNPQTITDKRGKVWDFTYDSKGNVLTKEDPLGHVWEYTYSSGNDVLTAEDPLGNMTTWTYHASGKVLTETDALSRVVRTSTYDTAGQELTRKNPANQTYQFAYNSNGDNTTITDPTSRVTTTAYNILGRITSVTNNNSKTTSFSYDDWGRQTTITYPGGGATKTTAYDREDNVTSFTDEESNTTTYAYDDSRRLTSVTNSLSEVESYGYNSNGWRTSVTNGRNKTRNYTYNNRGQVASLTMPDTAYESWAYDGNGNLTAYTNPKSEVVYYTFDDASRNTAIDYPSGTDVTFTLDNANRRTSMVDATGTTDWTFNSASQVTEIDSGQGTTQYTYSSTTMRRATMVHVGVGTFTYGYDAAGRLTSVQNPHSETTSYWYDTTGRLGSITYSSGSYVGIGYDDRDRQLWSNLRKADTTLLHGESWTYDDASNVLTHVNGGVTTTYGYDAANQLVSESRTGYSASYTYDANGNRLTKTIGGVTENYSYDDGDKLQDIKIGGVTQKSYGYDAAGRTTSVVTGAGTTTLSYDYEGRVTTITYPSTATNTFQYNAFDARVTKVDSAGTWSYLRDGADVVSPVISDGFATYTPGLSERRAGTTTFEKPGIKHFGVQHSGSQAIQATQTFDAFGNVASATGTWSGAFGYGGEKGYISDNESALLLLGHRYYDASIGRFLTRDPIKSGRNWYGYALNNPASKTDPSGLEAAGGGGDPIKIDPNKPKNSFGKLSWDVDGLYYGSGWTSGNVKIIGAGRVGPKNSLASLKLTYDAGGGNSFSGGGDYEDGELPIHTFSANLRSGNFFATATGDPFGINEGGGGWDDGNGNSINVKGLRGAAGWVSSVGGSFGLGGGGSLDWSYSDPKGWTLGFGIRF